jgi:PAP2 superfamily
MNESNESNRRKHHDDCELRAQGRRHTAHVTSYDVSISITLSLSTRSKVLRVGALYSPKVLSLKATKSQCVSGINESIDEQAFFQPPLAPHAIQPMRLTTLSRWTTTLVLCTLSSNGFHPQSPVQTSKSPRHSWSVRPRTIPTSTALSETTPDANQQEIFRGTNDDNSQKVMSQETTNSLLSTVVKTIGSTTSIVVAGTFYAVLCYQRDAFMVSFFVGAISNGILSKVLKKLLKQSRPAELDTSSMELAPSDNGMPSSHAMSLGFICTFTALSLPVTTLPLLAYALVSLKYRIETNLHSFEQIAVGAVVGSLNGALWWQLCTGALGGINIVSWVAASPVIDNQTGLLPWYLLSVPALVGAAVVGSVERRLARYFSNQKADSKDD